MNAAGSYFEEVCGCRLEVSGVLLAVEANDREIAMDFFRSQVNSSQLVFNMSV